MAHMPPFILTQKHIIYRFNSIQPYIYKWFKMYKLLYNKHIHIFKQSSWIIFFSLWITGNLIKFSYECRIFLRNTELVLDKNYRNVEYFVGHNVFLLKIFSNRRFDWFKHIFYYVNKHNWVGKQAYCLRKSFHVRIEDRALHSITGSQWNSSPYQLILLHKFQTIS